MLIINITLSVLLFLKECFYNKHTKVLYYSTNWQPRYPPLIPKFELGDKILAAVYCYWLEDSWVIPTTIPAMPCLVVRSIHWGKIQTILFTFLGITQKSPRNRPWVIPSLTSLTERCVHLLTAFKIMVYNVAWDHTNSCLTHKKLPTDKWPFLVVSLQKIHTSSIYRFSNTFSCILNEGIPKIFKKLNSHGGFLSYLQSSADN